MGVYIKNWSLADWKELLKWAKIGANNAMIGEFTEVEEVPPHGRLIDAGKLCLSSGFSTATEYGKWRSDQIESIKSNAPTVIEAEESET